MGHNVSRHRFLNVSGLYHDQELDCADVTPDNCRHKLLADVVALRLAEDARVRERKKNDREHTTGHENDHDRPIEKALARLLRRLDHVIAFLMHRDLRLKLKSPGPRRVPNLCTRSTLSPRITGCQPAQQG